MLRKDCGLPHRRELRECRCGPCPVAGVIDCGQANLEGPERQLSCWVLRQGAEHFGSLDTARLASLNHVLTPPPDPDLPLLSAEE